jgi:hypothetical protein
MVKSTSLPDVPAFTSLQSHLLQAFPSFVYYLFKIQVMLLEIFTSYLLFFFLRRLFFFCFGDTIRISANRNGLLEAGRRTSLHVEVCVVRAQLPIASLMVFRINTM